MHASCVAFISHINLPSPFSSHTVALSQVFHAPRVQTRRCPIYRHSHSFLTPFAFTHAIVLASDCIFTAFSPPPHSGALLFAHKDAFSPTFLSICIHSPLFSHPIAFSLLFHPLRFPARCSSRIRTHFLRLFSLSVFTRRCPRIRWHFLYV